MTVLNIEVFDLISKNGCDPERINNLVEMINKIPSFEDFRQASYLPKNSGYRPVVVVENAVTGHTISPGAGAVYIPVEVNSKGEVIKQGVIVLNSLAFSAYDPYVANWRQDVKTLTDLIHEFSHSLRDVSAKFSSRNLAEAVAYNKDVEGAAINFVLTALDNETLSRYAEYKVLNEIQSSYWSLPNFPQEGIESFPDAWFLNGNIYKAVGDAFLTKDIYNCFKNNEKTLAEMGLQGSSLENELIKSCRKDMINIRPDLYMDHYLDVLKNYAGLDPVYLKGRILNSLNRDTVLPIIVDSTLNPNLPFFRGIAIHSLSPEAQLSSTLLWLDKAIAFFAQAKNTVSPLILDLSGNGIIDTVGVKSGAYFDHAGDGFAEQTGWVGAKDGLLVWDRNKDGLINDGSELFGNNTKLADGSAAKNGFSALGSVDAIASIRQ